MSAKQKDLAKITLKIKASTGYEATSTFEKITPEQYGDAMRVLHNKPLDMVLHCPKCHKQHIDAPEYQDPNERDFGMTTIESRVWKNPPHRSHLCHGCGYIWRPADVPTNGVQAVTTKGKNDKKILKPGCLNCATAICDECDPKRTTL